MFRTNHDLSTYWDPGVPFGYSSYGYSPGSGEFGADPGALSQTTRQQWEMVPGHRDWEELQSPDALYFELTGRTDFGRKRREDSPDLRLAQEGGLVNLGEEIVVIAKPPEEGQPPEEGPYYLINGALYDKFGNLVNLGEEIVVIAQPPQPPTAFTPEERRAADAALNAGRVPPGNGLGAATIPSASHPSPGDSRLAPAPPNVSALPGPAVPGARSGAASSLSEWLSEWLYKDSLGIQYNGGSGDAIKQSLPVDTGSILGNYAINTWLSLSNVVAGSLTAGVVITNKVDDFFNRHLGYGAIQTMLPMSKAMGIAVEAGPAIQYASAWLSALLNNPRVVNALLTPIFGTLAAEGGGTLAPELERSLPFLSTSTSVPPQAVNPRLTARLAAWSEYRGQLSFPEWVNRTQGAPWGTGFPSGYARWFESATSPHGNSALSQRLAYLYARYNQSGQFLKWGITQDLAGRYTGTELLGQELIMATSGPRSEMLQLERELAETIPGPLNFEAWVGERFGDDL
jgi:hypothetical protein